MEVEVEEEDDAADVEVVEKEGNMPNGNDVEMERPESQAAGGSNDVETEVAAGGRDMSGDEAVEMPEVLQDGGGGGQGGGGAEDALQDSGRGEDGGRGAHGANH